MTYPVRVEAATATYERWSHEQHGPALHELNADAEVSRFLGGTQPNAVIGATSRHIAAHWDEHGFGLWAVVADGACVGFCGACHPWPDWATELQTEVELGWRLARRAWGRGSATEGARLALQALPAHLALPRVISFVAPDNARSIAVTRRLGMRPAGETVGGRVQTRVTIYELPLGVPAA